MRMEIENNSLTNNLNPQQAEAVQYLQGPLLILAGAGSGKTRVLTHRFANLIAQGLAAPENILAVTFTNKAAREMQERILKSLSSLEIYVREQLWISTFHSICTRILRKHIELLDYKKTFTIYDSSDQLSMIKRVLNQLQIDEKVQPAKNFQYRISNAKMQALSPEEVKKLNYRLMDQQSLKVYSEYEKQMKAANALDFDDLLLKTLDLFNQFPKVLKAYQDLFQYIMVDEYQDTNHIQYKLIHMLAREHKNLCVVGDEDQSIYSWRGADIQNILNFESDFLNSKTIKLEQNYRSTKSIVNAASALIKNNTERKNKVLFTDNDTGTQIQVREEMDEYAEAKFVAKNISLFLMSGEYKKSDIAVFYRNNAQSRALEEHLRLQAIDYKVVGGLKFYDRMEVKDILSYMRLVVNPADDIAFKRIINVPTRGIGKTSVEKLEALAAQKSLPLWPALQIACRDNTFNAGLREKFHRFNNIILNLMQFGEQSKVSEFYHKILEETKYIENLNKDESVEAQNRVDNLEELDNALRQFELERGDEATVVNFLEEMALVSDADSMREDEESVSMMTLHISKGLEYPIVFIVGLEEGLFPSTQAVENMDPSAIEEERRLAYVGITRARKHLFLLYSRSRRLWGNVQYNAPSRFLSELPAEYLQKTSAVPAPSRFASTYLNQTNSAASSNSGYKNNYSKSSSSFDFSDDMPNYEDASQDSWDFIDNSKKSKAEFQAGMKVRHPSFGTGSIFEVKGDGEQARISIVFNGNLIKTFVAKYARLEKL